MRVITLFISVCCLASLGLSITGCGGQSGASAGTSGPPDPVHGQQLFQQNCSSCHGGNAQGLPHAGANLRKSKLVATSTDQRLVQFVKVGRPVSDPENQSGVLMPPLGGNRQLDESGVLDIIAHLRNVQQEAKLDPADEEQEQSASAEK